MLIPHDVLTGYQVVETRSAGKWRLALVALQLFSTAPVALSVYVATDTGLFYLAAVNLLGLMTWWLVNARYGKHRHAAQTARRVNIYTNGLGLRLSAFEWSQISQAFLASRVSAESARRSDYYATRSPPSYKRLAEIVEESAFYSHRVQQASATAMSFIVALFFLAGVIALVLVLPAASSNVLLAGVRFYLACTVFVMSSDVFGAMSAHRSAAEMASRVSTSLSRTSDGGILDGDIMLAATEYIAGMAKAPEPLPFLYELNRKRIDADWAAWMIAKQG